MIAANMLNNGAFGESSPPQAFVKIPQEDRTKYEKLGSNDVTSDDSDSEFFQNETGGSGGSSGAAAAAIGALSAKKTIFKQIVANNIQDKIHAVYSKVDKTQVKVQPIVRKLKSKATGGGGTSVGSGVSNANKKERTLGGKKTDNRKQSAPHTKPNQDDGERSDNDSIGSASDLRTEDDVFDVESGAAGEGPYRPMKLQPKKMFDDTISESVKTCGSSAYHAECESVTTNEDNVSRVVVRVRMRKKDRMNDSTNTIIDENQLSPSSADLLHQYGDKPLLLDDELDYDSGEDNTESKEEEQSPEELDVFAMAPFKMPQNIVKKIRTTKKRTAKVKCDSETSAMESKETADCLAFNQELSNDAIWTSTPKKPIATEAANVFSTYLQPVETLQTEPTYHSVVVTPTLPAVPVNQFEEPVFNPFPANIHHVPGPAQSSSDYGLVTVSNSGNSSMTRVAATTQRADRDLFGSEPFQVIPTNAIDEKPAPNLTVINIETNNNKIVHPLSYHQQSPQTTVSVVTVNQSIVINKFAEPLQLQSANSITSIATATTANRKYVNFSHIDPHPAAASIYKNNTDHILPIADNEFVSTPNAFSDEEEEVLATVASGKSSKKEKKEKKDKSTSKFYLKEKSSGRNRGNGATGKDDDTASMSGVRLPSLLSAKVKSTASYKKVSSGKKQSGSAKGAAEDDDDDHQYFQSNTLKTNNTKIGFSNLSFEDFPSDQELDILNPVDGANRTKTTPFEVIRNEKMLLEAEKKFGSLKRRTNLFS